MLQQKSFLTICRLMEFQQFQDWKITICWDIDLWKKVEAFEMLQLNAIKWPFLWKTDAVTRALQLSPWWAPRQSHDKLKRQFLRQAKLTSLISVARRDSAKPSAVVALSQCAPEQQRQISGCNYLVGKYHQLLLHLVWAWQARAHWELWVDRNIIFSQFC